ncbi:MAG: thiamine phosphate synthase [Gemmatimonadetes bacterium]|nr:thiamine phosphate synthase [Gemmatimonadota bacterium]NNM07079.1 thiamine phosphate synthase [Gemmatimonadota bacterium]
MILAEALRLIVITDGLLAHPRTVEEVVVEVLRAGVKAIQLRDKEASARELLDHALVLRGRTREFGALLFINDRLDVALAAAADGVHLGPNDLPVHAARRASPPGFLIGTSTDIPDVAVELQAAGADYIGCGTVFQTITKKDAGEVIGIEGLAAVAAVVDIPVVGIGGVSPEGAGQIAEGSGAVGTAVIRAVMASSNPGRVAKKLMAPFGGRGPAAQERELLGGSS